MRYLGPEKPADVTFNFPPVINLFSIFSSEACFFKVNCILDILFRCSISFPGFQSYTDLSTLTRKAEGENERLWNKTEWTDRVTYVGGNGYTELFIAALFVTATEWKQSKCPSLKDWFTKLCHIPNMEYQATIKKNEADLHVLIWKVLQDR